MRMLAMESQAKPFPGTNSLLCWLIEGKGDFFLYYFEELFIPEWKPDLLGRIRRLTKQR